MKTKELISLLQKSDPSGEFEVAIPIWNGCGGPRANIRAVGLGFDWYQNIVCLDTVQPLVLLQHLDYRTDQLSNYKKLLYCRVKDHSQELFVCKKSNKVKVDQIIEIRKCGKDNSNNRPEFFKVKINKLLTTKETLWDFPECWVEKV